VVLWYQLMGTFPGLGGNTSQPLAAAEYFPVDEPFEYCVKV